MCISSLVTDPCMLWEDLPTVSCEAPLPVQSSSAAGQRPAHWQGIARLLTLAGRPRFSGPCLLSPPAGAALTADHRREPQPTEPRSVPVLGGCKSASPRPRCPQGFFLPKLFLGSGLLRFVDTRFLPVSSRLPLCTSVSVSRCPLVIKICHWTRAQTNDLIVT